MVISPSIYLSLTEQNGLSKIDNRGVFRNMYTYQMELSQEQITA